MPNWVFNTVIITGPSVQVDPLIERLGRPAPSDAFGGTEQKVLSFWNLVAPTDLDAYFELVGTGGRSMTDPLGWYDWNCQHWGTKWDAQNSELLVDASGGVTSVTFSFDTAWSPPEPIFDALESICASEQLLLWIRAENEEDCQLTISFDGRTGAREFCDLDTPESHAEYVERDQTCRCESYFGGSAPPEDEWIESTFLDCPPMRGLCSGCDAPIRLVKWDWTADDNSTACLDGNAHRLPKVPSISESAATFLRCFGGR